MPVVPTSHRWYDAVLVVALVVVAILGLLSFVLYETPPPTLSQGSGRGHFVMYYEGLATCPLGDNFTTDGCTGGDYTYSVEVLSNINFGQVSFQVNTSTGGTYVATGGSPGFSFETLFGTIPAEWRATDGRMAMIGPWETWTYSRGIYLDGAYYGGATATTPLTNFTNFLIDMGAENPHGMGYSLVALGQAGYSGYSAPLALP
jgi:hypothetical protein